MKRVVIILLCVLFADAVYAQATIEELLDVYVSASVSGENATPYATRINQYYKNYSLTEKTALKDKLFGLIKKCNKIELRNLKEKTAYIDLYVLLSDIKDERLDDLYFLKGEVCGLHTADTVGLKDCITELKLSYKSKTPKVDGYICTLRDYLEDIRNFRPTSQSIDGVWVSDCSLPGDLLMTPAYILIISNGRAKLDLSGYAYAFTEMNITGKVKSEEQTYTQRIIDREDNNVYMAWSNEKLKIPNQSIALGLEQTAGDITNSFVHDGVSSLLTTSFIGDMTTNVASGIASSIVTGFISDALAPSKTIHTLEINIQKINDLELVGYAIRQAIEIKGDNTPVIKKNTEKVLFTRYDSHSGVYFDSSILKKKKLLLPGLGLFDKIPNKYVEINKAFSKYGNSVNKSPVMKKGTFGALLGNMLDVNEVPFNIHQNKKLQYYTEQIKLQKGLNIIGAPKNTYMGVITEPSKEKKEKILKRPGVYVYNVDKTSPAYIFGIKQEDIILGIDSYEIDTPQKLEQYIQSLKPYDWVTVHIKRGKKEMDIEVELTWN